MRAMICTAIMHMHIQSISFRTNYNWSQYGTVEYTHGYAITSLQNEAIRVRSILKSFMLDRPEL